MARKHYNSCDPSRWVRNPVDVWFCRPENLLRSVDLINEKLRGTKRLDLFQCARVDPNVPVEESIATLARLKDQGKLDHIGMSECSAETLRHGHKVGVIRLCGAGESNVLVDSPDQRCGDRSQSFLV